MPSESTSGAKTYRMIVGTLMVCLIAYGVLNMFGVFR